MGGRGGHLVGAHGGWSIVKNFNPSAHAGWHGGGAHAGWYGGGLTKATKPLLLDHRAITIMDLPVPRVDAVEAFRVAPENIWSNVYEHIYASQRWRPKATVQSAFVCVHQTSATVHIQNWNSGFTISANITVRILFGPLHLYPITATHHQMSRQLDMGDSYKSPNHRLRSL